MKDIFCILQMFFYLLFLRQAPNVPSEELTVLMSSPFLKEKIKRFSLFRPALCKHCEADSIILGRIITLSTYTVCAGVNRINTRVRARSRQVTGNISYRYEIFSLGCSLNVRSSRYTNDNVC